MSKSTARQLLHFIVTNSGVILQIMEMCIFF